MNSDALLKTILNLSILALLASCAPKTADSASYSNSADDSSGIIGGADSTLEYAQKNGIVGVFDLSKGALCTGSLLENGLILTAGHCVNVDNPSKMIIFFGPNFDDIIAEINEHNYSHIRKVLKVTRHEKYKIAESAAPDKKTKKNGSRPQKSSQAASENDIALIRFNGPVAEGYVPASLATLAMAPELKSGAKMTLAGYGLSEFKADPSTHTPLVEKGSGLLRQVDGIRVMEVLSTYEEIMLDQTTGRGACHGDSGGPAYLQDVLTKKNFLVGVTSRGTGNCDEIAIYTGVIGYTNWIQQQSQQLLH